MSNKNLSELEAEARSQTSQGEFGGHDIMSLMRFLPDTRHMIVFDVLTYQSPVGFKGERIRVFLNEDGYQKALDTEKNRDIKILKHAKVVSGKLQYDCQKDTPTAAPPNSTAKEHKSKEIER